MATAACRSSARSSSRSPVPTAATAGTAATSCWSPTRRSRRCCRTTTRRTAPAATAASALGDHRSGAQGESLELPVPVGTVVKDADGTTLVDMIEPGMRFVAAPGGIGGLGNASLASPKRKAPGFALLGTPGLGGRPRPRAEDGRRRRSRRLPLGRQVEPDRRHLRRAPEDRRLPLHHPAPEPRRGAVGRHPLHRRRCARPDRGRERGPRPRPRIPAARRALHRARARARLRDARPRS